MKSQHQSSVCIVHSVHPPNRSRDASAEAPPQPMQRVVGQDNETQCRLNLLLRENELLARHARELTKANERLERKLVEQRHQHEAWVATEKLALDGRMAATIAHEINNPLNGIISSFQIVKHGLAPEHPDYPFVGLIEREIQRIATIVRRMHALYKPQPDSSCPFDLCQLIRDVLKLSQPLALSRGVQLVHELPGNPLHVIQPEAAVSEVLYNLVKNATEASPPNSEVHVILQLRGSNSWIQVADRGSGIVPELGERIFEPFFSTKIGPEQIDTGLGLSVVRSQVKAMAGRMWFESEAGRGTIFHVELPCGTTGDAS